MGTQYCVIASKCNERGNQPCQTTQHVRLLRASPHNDVYGKIMLKFQKQTFRRLRRAATKDALARSARYFRELAELTTAKRQQKLAFANAKWAFAIPNH